MYNKDIEGGEEDGRTTVDVREFNDDRGRLDVSGHTGISGDGEIQQGSGEVRNNDNQSGYIERAEQRGDIGSNIFLSDSTKQALINKGITPVAIKSSKNNAELFYNSIAQAFRDSQIAQQPIQPQPTSTTDVGIFTPTQQQQ